MEDTVAGAVGDSIRQGANFKYLYRAAWVVVIKPTHALIP